jgi:glycosyltransferase involved in cell wall biosynthesis
MTLPIHICHFTTVHPRDDVRVFYKQCISLAKEGLKVTLIVADGKGNEFRNGVDIIDIGKSSGGRFTRITKTSKTMFNKLLQIDADIYQFHDPELLSTGGKLKKLGKNVVFDSHEDVPKQILYKTWLGPLFLRKLFAKVYNKFEKSKVQKLDGLISVIEEITNQFDCPRKVTIKNFPIIEYLIEARKPFEKRNDHIVYVGSITKPRGVLDYIKAMEKIPEPYRLILIGHFIPAHLLEECKELPGWNRVDYLGFKTLDELSQLLGSAKIGLSVLHAEKNYLQSLPTKGFEYMAAGLPLIMSDFEYWKPYFEGCAIHIEPAQSDLIASAIMELINDSSKYSSLATEASLKCVHYSWEGQFKLLHQFYQEILTS